MADIATDLKNWSTTEGSNSPTGGTVVGAGLDDNLRRIQATVRQDLASKGSDVASTATADVGAVAGFAHDITGTTTITGLGTVSGGIHKVLKFEGALTLTHNATSLILPGGANITTADGDIGWFISEGSGNWRCITYFRTSGVPVVGTQSAGTVFAGPTAGSAAVPTFRSLGITEIVAPTAFPAANTVTLSSIPQYYAALVLVVSGASSDTATRHILVQPNADATAGNYTGTVIQAGTPATPSEATIGGPGNQTAAETTSGTFVLTGYQAGPFTNCHSNGVYAATSWSSLTTHLSTSAVTSIRIIWNSTGDYDAGTYSLYGVN